MKKDVLMKTVDLIKDYNDDLFSLLRKIRNIQKGDSKKFEEVPTGMLQEALILVSILLSGNIKARYELEEFLKDNKAFANMATLKSISTNCKQDIDALKSTSFNLAETLKSIQHKEDEQRYKESNL